MLPTKEWVNNGKMSDGELRRILLRANTETNVE